MRYCIDRFEGDTGVLDGEDGDIRQVPRGELPDGSAEGDWLIPGPGGEWRADPEYTEDTRRRVRQKMDRLWE